LQRISTPVNAITSRDSRLSVARYTIVAKGGAGPIEFLEPVTIDAALARAQELRDAHFEHITITNVLTGVAIEDLEALLQQRSQD
jgi:hypothetical protein